MHVSGGLIWRGLVEPDFGGVGVASTAIGTPVPIAVLTDTHFP